MRGLAAVLGLRHMLAALARCIARERYTPRLVFIVFYIFISLADSNGSAVREQNGMTGLYNKNERG